MVTPTRRILPGRSLSNRRTHDIGLSLLLSLCISALCSIASPRRWTCNVHETTDGRLLYPFENIASQISRSCLTVLAAKAVFVTVSELVLAILHTRKQTQGRARSNTSTRQRSSKRQHAHSRLLFDPLEILPHRPPRTWLLPRSCALRQRHCSLPTHLFPLLLFPQPLVQPPRE